MADPEAIYKWHRIDGRVTTSGQPTEPQLAEIAALGVSHLINLAPHSHAKALPDERSSAACLGMRYTNIPVDFQDPDEDDFARFCAVMAEARAVPVHVHCAANYRVSAFMFRYRRRVLGIEEAAARADLDRVWRPEGAWVAFVER